MASFGHDAESLESGGQWQLTTIGTDEEEKWRLLLLVGPGGAWARFLVCQNRKGQYYWEWTHHELGHSTTMEARRSFQTRALCLQSLWQAMRTTRSLGGLVEDMERWERS